MSYLVLRLCVILITWYFWCPHYVSITLLHWLKCEITSCFFFHLDVRIIYWSAWKPEQIQNLLKLSFFNITACVGQWRELGMLLSSFWFNFKKLSIAKFCTLPLWCKHFCIEVLLLRNPFLVRCNQCWIWGICFSEASSQHPDRKLICEFMLYFPFWAAQHSVDQIYLHQLPVFPVCLAGLCVCVCVCTY